MALSFMQQDDPNQLKLLVAQYLASQGIIPPDVTDTSAALHIVDNAPLSGGPTSSPLGLFGQPQSQPNQIAPIVNPQAQAGMNQWNLLQPGQGVVQSTNPDGTQNAPININSPQPNPAMMGAAASQFAPKAAERDYSRPMVDGPNGRGFYGKDGKVYTPDGKVMELMTPQQGAERRANEAHNMALEKFANDQAHTQALTEQSKAATINAQLKPVTPVPMGYEPAPGGGLQPIKNGPADIKNQAAFSGDVATLQSSMADLDRLAASANELKNAEGLSHITGLAGKIPNIPGMAGANAAAKLETLKSQIGFGVLQAMRNASKTGGALGNVSDAEGKRLEANLAALDTAQSTEEFTKSLQKVVDFTDGAKTRLADAFNLHYGSRLGDSKANAQGGADAIYQKNKATAPPPTTVPQVGEVRRGYKFLGGNPSDQSRWMKVNG